jgi:hypothetical protein
MLTPQEIIDDAVRREREAQDLADIAELGRTQGWTRYFHRRLRQRIDMAKETVIYDDKITKERREEIRQQVLALEDLERMPSKDEGSIRASQSNNPASQ